MKEKMIETQFSPSFWTKEKVYEKYCPTPIIQNIYKAMDKYAEGVASDIIKFIEENSFIRGEGYQIGMWFKPDGELFAKNFEQLYALWEQTKK